MLPFHEWTLVQQRDAVPFVRKLVEFIEESIPRRLVGIGVDWIDGENIAVVAVGQDGARILPDKVGPKGHVAAKAVCIEMLFTELEILAQRTQPLCPRERPERERVLGRRPGSTVVDRLVRIVERRPAYQVQRREQQVAAGEPGIVAGIPEKPGRDTAIDEPASPGLCVVPQLAAPGREQ